MQRDSCQDEGDQRPSLHTALKYWYAGPEDQIEALVGGYRVDVLREDLLIEIQTASLIKIRDKLRELMQEHRVLLVHPIAQEKWIVQLDPESGERLGRRKSPKRGRITDVFTELVHLPTLVNHPNLALEVLFIQEEELRCADGKGSWRRRGISIVGRELLDVVERRRFDSGADFLHLLPEGLVMPFTNRDLARALHIRLRQARRMTYCFRKMRVLQTEGKQGRELLFRRVSD
jgi:hypothetical protein